MYDRGNTPRTLASVRDRLSRYRWLEEPQQVRLVHPRSVARCDRPRDHRRTATASTAGAVRYAQR